MPRTEKQRLYLEDATDKALHALLVKHRGGGRWAAKQLVLEDGTAVDELRLYRAESLFASDAESLADPEYVVSLVGATFVGSFRAVHEACLELTDVRGRTVVIEATLPSTRFQLRVWVDRETAAALA